MFEDITGGLHFGSNDDQAQYGYSVENTNVDYINLLKPLENEWFYALMATDEQLGYRFLTWQETDPANHAFYAINLSDIFEVNAEVQGHQIWADIAINSHGNAANLDIESIAVYEFEKFIDTEEDVPSANTQAFTYADDQEKYKLAVQLFEGRGFLQCLYAFQRTGRI